LRQAHILIGGAARIGPADQRRNRGRVLVQEGGHVGDDLLPISIDRKAVGVESDSLPDSGRSGRQRRRI
jgi:hypothetical protein